MNLFIIFSSILVTAFSLPTNEIKSNNFVVPAIVPDGRITKGREAAIGQFPYQVSISLRTRTSKQLWCGGSLIGNQWILTAAHCTKGFSTITVYLGSIIRNSGEIEYRIADSDIIIHPRWNDKRKLNDIALIKIPFTPYSDNIQPVRLPAIYSSYSPYESADVIVSGWGRLHTFDRSFPDYLHWAKLNVISNRDCFETFKIVHSSHLCTSTIDAVNICDGDSGGALVLEDSGVQIGITEAGFRICEESYPTVYTRVTSYLEWIKNNTGIFY